MLCYLCCTCHARCAVALVSLAVCSEGEDKPNKKFYDPRVWLRKGEESAVARLGECMDDLNCKGVLG